MSVLVVALLFLLPSGLVCGQGTDPALSRLVRPTPGTRPLGAVLAELSRQGHLPMSYSSSFVPVAHPAHLAAGPARPLGVILAELLAAERLSFGLLNGQLVLWRAHSAFPTGVVAVNGRPTESAKPARLPAASTAASVSVVPATGAANRTDKTAAARSRLVGSSAPVPRPGGTPFTSPTKPTKGVVTRLEAPIARDKALTPRPSASVSAAAPATQRSTRAPKPPGAEGLRTPSSTAATKQTSLGKRVVAKARTKTTAANRPIAAQRSAPTRTTRQVDSSAAKLAPARSAIAGSPTRVPANGSSRRRAAAQPNLSLAQTASQPEAATTQVASARQLPSGSDRAPVDLLTSRPVLPTRALESGSLPPVLLTSAEPRTARSPSANPENVATNAKTPFALANLLRPSYLHAEAWGSETLPLNAAGKVGIPRIYLTLGVAAGPFGRGPGTGGLAWGAGFGTAGQPRGRFTPSLDLMQWFLPGDRNMPGTQLTQLRLLLAWQLKPGGRLQIIGGPSLNLATGPRDGGGGRPPHGDGELGQGQWLWLNSGDNRSFLRLWPGVQLGLRF